MGTILGPEDGSTVPSGSIFGCMPGRRRTSGRGWLAAAAVIGLAATNSHGTFAQASMKDGSCDPYKNYSCLDAYLGDGILERFFNYYKLEWGQGSAPTDPKAPPSRIEGWPRTPATIPPCSLHGMADRCHHQHWRYAAQFSRQPLHERHRQHGCRQMAG